MTKQKVNNDFYQIRGDAWWDDDVGGFSSIRFFINPVRFRYFKRVCQKLSGEAATGKSILDIGCGGGILAEDLARLGLSVTGVDISPETINTAKKHADSMGLSIRYQVASVEELPFADDAFDMVSCCDVLEHLDDVDRAVCEAARVLKPGGMFFFDTINRTFLSRLVVIKIMQDWSFTAFVPPNCHVWEYFIKPEELESILSRNGLQQAETRGISTLKKFGFLTALRKRARGKMDFRELADILGFHESKDLHVSYMGYALKQ